MFWYMATCHAKVYSIFKSTAGERNITDTFNNSVFDKADGVQFLFGLHQRGFDRCLW